MSLLNPLVVNTDCECPTPTAAAPSQPSIPVSTQLDITTCFEKVCGTCDDKIVAAAPQVPAVVPNKTCYQFDPAYCAHWVRLPQQTGLTLLIIAVDPSRGAIQKGGSYCDTLCADADILDQNSEFSVGDHSHEWLPGNVLDSESQEVLPAATVPLKFYVDPTHASRINCERGYVVLGNKNWANYWWPRECIENQFINTGDQPFPLGAMNLSLDPAAALIGNTIGTAPLIEVQAGFAPTARNVVDTTAVDTPVVTDLAASAFDVDGDLDPTSVALIDPADGIEKDTVVVGDVSWDATAANGTVTFTPTNGATGTFTINWVIYDSDVPPNRSNVATYSVTVA